MKKISLAAAVLIILITIPLRAQSNEAGAVIEKVIEAYGGRENILSIKSYRMEAAIQAHIQAKNGKVTRIIEIPSRVKILIRYPSDMEIRLLAGERVLRGFSPEKIEPVEGPLKESVILQASRSNIPWILDSKKSEVKLIKEGKYSPVLELVIGKGMLMRVFVDAKTYLISKVETSSEGQMKIEFATEFSDFRKVGEVLFPFHEENYASGAHTATTKIENIKLNLSGEDLNLPFKN